MNAKNVDFFGVLDDGIKKALVERFHQEFQIGAGEEGKDDEVLLEQLQKFLEVLFYHDIQVEVYLSGLGEEIVEQVNEYLEGFIDSSIASVLNEGMEYHYLPIRKRFHYKVLDVSEQLSESISEALTHFQDKSFFSVLVESVSKVIREDSRKRNPYAYKIYIFDSKLPSDSYSYLYGKRSCPTFMDMGYEDRYIWIDLSASTLFWGPNTGEIGSSQYISLEDPMLAVSISSVVHKISDRILSPSLHNNVQYLDENPTFVFIRIYHGRTTSDFQYSDIIDQINANTMLGKPIKYKFIDIQVEECLDCGVLINHGLKYYSRTRDYSEYPYLKYLDSDQLLYYWKKGYGDSILRQFDLMGENIFPVVIFSLSESLPLDRNKLVVSKENVIFISDTSPGVYHDFMCGNNIVSTTIETSKKALYNAIYKSIWEVPSLYEYFDVAHNHRKLDFFFSLQDYPFRQDYNPGQYITMNLRDAAPRNIIYTEIHLQISQINELFQNFRKYNSEIHQVMKKDEIQTFIQRWELFIFKLNETQTALSLFKYEECDKYLKLIQYDIDAMHELLHVASRRFNPLLICEDKYSKRIRVSRLLALLSTIVLFIVFTLTTLRKNWI